MLLCFLVLFYYSPLVSSGAGYRPDPPYAYLAINSMASAEIAPRRLEIDWIGADPDTHVAVLYGQDPDVDPAAEKLMSVRVEHSDGHLVTSFHLPYVTSESLGYASKCVFDFWIRIEDSEGNAHTKPRCLRSQPSWMSDNEDALGNVLLSDLMMTGTHDSAAYKPYDGPDDDNPVTLAVFAQEESLEQQLQWGARVLDIRVGHYPTTPEKFWLVHNIIKTHPLSEGLGQLRRFLANSRDIFVVQIGGFRQVWTPDVHSQLIEILYSSLGRWWVKPDARQWQVSLDSVWNRPDLPEGEGRIILFYDGTYGDPKLFFDHITQRWGNKDDPHELEEYLDEQVMNAVDNPGSYHPWIPFCQMTPNAEDIIFERWFGLRDMADAVNRNVTIWWAKKPHYSIMTGVYPAHDFFLSTDMINVGIERSLTLSRGA